MGPSHTPRISWPPTHGPFAENSTLKRPTPLVASYLVHQRSFVSERKGVANAKPGTKLLSRLPQLQDVRIWATAG